VVNLVARSVISQFDMPKTKKLRGDIADGDGDQIEDDSDDSLREMLAEIRELAGNLDEDEQDELDDVPPEERADQEDNEEVDFRLGMDREALKELARDVMPARRMLVKVSWCLLVLICVQYGCTGPGCWSTFAPWAQGIIRRRANN